MCFYIEVHFNNDMTDLYDKGRVSTLIILTTSNLKDYDNHFCYREKIGQKKIILVDVIVFGKPQLSRGIPNYT